MTDRAPPPARGCLFLVVGPSGVGKDSVITGLRDHLGAGSNVVFARRFITRSADAGGEDHRPVSDQRFEEMLAAGGFMLHWRAHDHRYGIAAGLIGELDAGRHVIVNVSRSVVDEARRRYRPVHVLHVTASTRVLRERLHARGRETAGAIERRVARAGQFDASGPDVTTIENDGPLSASVAAALSVIRAFAPAR